MDLEPNRIGVNMAHTSEPWECDKAFCSEHNTETQAIYHRDGFHVMEVVETGCRCGDESVSEEDAERIVTCVNACKGIPNGMPTGSVKELADMLDEVTQFLGDLEHGNRKSTPEGTYGRVAKVLAKFY